VRESNLLRQWWRLGGFFGIAFVVMFIVAIVVQQVLAGEPPTYDEPLDEIRTFWEDEGQGYLVGNYLFALANLLLFLPFLAALRALLGIAEGGGQIFARTTLLAGLLTVAITSAATAAWTALAFATENLDDSVVTALMYLDVAAWSSVPMPFGVFLLAASVVIFLTGVLWRWLAILGVIVAIAGFITPLGILDADPEDPFDFVGFIAFLGFAVWLVLTSIAMILRKEAPATGTATPGVSTP
jgi:hypothetical protein